MQSSRHKTTRAAPSTALLFTRVVNLPLLETRKYVRGFRSHHTAVSI